MFGLAYVASRAAGAWQSARAGLPRLEPPRWGARLFARWRGGAGAHGYDGSLSSYAAGGEGVGEDWLAAAVQGAPWTACSCASICCCAQHPRLPPLACGPPTADDWSVLGGGGYAGGAARAAARRATPGFLPQFYWSLGRAMLLRLREPLAIFTDYAIFALTGAFLCGAVGKDAASTVWTCIGNLQRFGRAAMHWPPPLTRPACQPAPALSLLCLPSPPGMTLGLISDRGRETIMHFAGGWAWAGTEGRWAGQRACFSAAPARAC